jgi:hypothetical protein
MYTWADGGDIPASAGGWQFLYQAELALNQTQDVLPPEKAFGAFQRATSDVWIQGSVLNCHRSHPTVVVRQPGPAERTGERFRSSRYQGIGTVSMPHHFTRSCGERQADELSAIPFPSPAGNTAPRAEKDGNGTGDSPQSILAFERLRSETGGRLVDPLRNSPRRAGRRAANCGGRGDTESPWQRSGIGTAG